MANTIYITKVSQDAQALEVFFRIVLSGTYTQVASGGEVLNFFNALQGSEFMGLYAGVIASNVIPIGSVVNSTAGQSHWTYQFVRAALSACILKVLSAYNTEVAQSAAYDATVIADTIEGSFVLNKGI